MRMVIAEKRASRASLQKRAGIIQRITRSNLFWGYLMIAPLMLGLLIFYIWPVFQTLYFSFTRWGIFGTYTWTGISNYVYLFHDPELGKALSNTFIFTVISVVGSIAISLFVAVLLNQKIRGVTIYRTIYFLPTITMPVAIAIVWKWLYNGNYGLINYVLSLFSIHGPDWVSDPHIALYSIILIAIWGSIGNNMILFLAGLQNIPSVYYEAASLDGAGPFQKFFRVTLPLLSPTIFFVTITSLITSFQTFDLIYLIAGPTSLISEATQTVVYLFYQSAFINGNKGYAAAIAVFLFIIILFVTIIQLRLQKRWVHYA
jgi:multiple sugar transport system permease protein